MITLANQPFKSLMLYLLLCAPIMTAHAKQASTDNIVEALQMPAWYERAGVEQALRPGTELEPGDIIRTGESARVLLRLAEGSIVKLGADARFRIERLDSDPQTGGVFDALLSVLRGAFRFTTTELGLNRKRKVDVNIGTFAIGIRGTDIWGRSRDGSDLFALLEGKVSVQHDGAPAFTMQDPLTYVTADSGKPMSAIQTADMATVNTLAAETELQNGKGVLTIGGEWTVNLMSLQNDTAALALQEQLTRSGYAADIETTEVKGTVYTRLRIRGFASREDAGSFAGDIDNQYGIRQPWIIRL